MVQTKQHSFYSGGKTLVTWNEKNETKIGHIWYRRYSNPQEFNVLENSVTTQYVPQDMSETVEGAIVVEGTEYLPVIADRGTQTRELVESITIDDVFYDNKQILTYDLFEIDGKKAAQIGRGSEIIFVGWVADVKLDAKSQTERFSTKSNTVSIGARTTKTRGGCGCNK
jgi:5'(3')-deoxyribonucleotidase